MLVKMIELNMILTQKYQFRAMIPLAFLLPLMFLLSIFSSTSSVFLMELLLGVETAWGFICIIAMMHRLYSQSLFGEEAYIYMQFPVSHGKIIASKIVTASMQTIWIVIGIIICGAVVFYGYTFSKVEVSYLEGDPFGGFVKIIISATGFFGLEISATVIAVIIATSIIAIAIECFLICSEIQLVVIAAKLYGAEFSRIAVGAVAAIAAIIVYVACAAIPLYVLLLISKGHFYVWQMFAVMILKSAIGVAFMQPAQKSWIENTA